MLHVHIYVRKNKLTLTMVTWRLRYVSMSFEMLFCILSIGNVMHLANFMIFWKSNIIF